MKLLLPILFFIFIFRGVAQEIPSKWSSAIEKSEGEVPYKIMPTSDSGYALVKRIRGVKNAVTISIMDSNNVIVASSKVEVQDDKILNIELINEKLTVFAVKHNLETKEDILHAYTLTTEGKLSGTTKIASLKSNGGYLAIYKVTVSENGEKVGVLCERPYRKDKNEELVIKILDKELQETLTKDYSYTFPSTKRRFNVPFINNDGSLYIVKRTRVKASNKYFITLIKESGIEEHRDLKLRNMRIADVSGAFTKEGNLILSGFYAGYSSLSFEGTFSFRFNESTIPVYRKEFMLPENLILGLKSKKEISKFGTGLGKYHIKKLLLTPKGASYLIAEHLSVVKTEKQTIDTRKGLAIIKFSAKGDFLWASPILIDQVDKKDKGYWSSIVVAGNDEKLFIIHNPVGEDLKKVASVYGENSLIGTKTCTINLNGKVSHEAFVGLFSELPESVVLNAKASYFSGENLIIVAENKEKNKCYIGKLSLFEEE